MKSMEVVLAAKRGPLAGKRFPLRLGRVVLGRNPGPEGVTLPRDAAVSERHGELYESEGRLFYRNLSRQGTLVNRKLVRYAEALSPGDTLGLGDVHVLEVRFRAPARPTAGKSGAGLLASTPLRVGLALYLAAFVGAVVFFGTREEASVSRAWEAARNRYLELYQPPDVPLEERRTRLARADVIVRELAALERTENRTGARTACRELMAIDSDPASPVYRFGAMRLASLAGRR